LLIASSRDYVIPTVQSMANFHGGVYDFAGGVTTKSCQSSLIPL